VAIPKGSRATLVAVPTGNNEVSLGLRSVSVKRPALRDQHQQHASAGQKAGVGQRTSARLSMWAWSAGGTLIGALRAAAKEQPLVRFAGGAAGAARKRLPKGRA